MSFALIRSKGPIVGDGQILSARQLRAGIPAALLLTLQIEAALSGRLRTIDTATGEEVGPAVPIPLPERLKLMQTLIDKRLPMAKASEIEDDGPVADLTKIDLDIEEVKRMPLSQLARVVEASFRVLKEPTHGDTPTHPTPPVPNQVHPLRPRTGDPSVAEQDGGAGGEAGGAGDEE